MDLFKHFGLDIEQIFVFEKLGSLIRLAILLIVGMPLLYMFSKWVRKYVAKKLSAQQGMIFSKLVLYLGVFIITFSILNEFGFK